MQQLVGSKLGELLSVWLELVGGPDPLCPVARLALSPTSHLATHSAHSDCRTLIVTTPSIDLTGCSQISLLVTEELTVCKWLHQVALSPDSHQFPIPFSLLPHWQPPRPRSLCCKCGGRESGPRPLLRMFRASPATSRGEGHAGTRARPPPTPTPHTGPITTVTATSRLIPSTTLLRY